VVGKSILIAFLDPRSTEFLIEAPNPQSIHGMTFEPLKTKTGTETQTVEAVEGILRRGDCLSVSALAVNGRELMSIGFGGREIGTTLDKLLSAVLEDPTLNTREALLALARDMKNE
ncbi:MAG: hypothetical protein IKV00_05375, partial [Clostridia bacterium]|nr:hypothetical protein [Clostridia bacterium]